MDIDFKLKQKNKESLEGFKIGFKSAITAPFFTLSYLENFLVKSKVEKFYLSGKQQEIVKTDSLPRYLLEHKKFIVYPKDLVYKVSITILSTISILCTTKTFIVTKDNVISLGDDIHYIGIELRNFILQEDNPNLFDIKITFDFLTLNISEDDGEFTYYLDVRAFENFDLKLFNLD